MGASLSGNAVVERVTVTLYVAGDGERSRASIERVSSVVTSSKDSVSFDVVDVLDDPERAETDRVITTPMLVRWTPGPVQRIVGDLDETDVAALLNVVSVPLRVTDEPLAEQDISGRSSEILSRAAHELRTPLAVIRGFANTLVASIDQMDHEAAVKAAEAVVRSSMQLQTMLESMLVLEAVEVDGLQLDLADWELGDIVLDAIQDLAPILARHQVQTTIQDGLRVRVDAPKIRQVLINLLSNAAKYSAAGTKVSVSVAAREGLGVVSVEDQGQGIPYDHLQKLFTKYERLGRSEKGTGLGLYISRGLARVHKGEIKAFSDGETGSRFELTLPLRN